MDVIIKQPYEQIVTCASCSQAAYRRHLDVGVPGVQIRTISYDTHAECHTAEDQAAVGRMKAFHERLFAMVADLKAAVGSDAFRLSVGRITEIDLGNVIPTACLPRSEVLPSVTVRAFKRERFIPFQIMPLAELSMESLLDLVRPACESAVLEIQEQYAAAHPGDE